MSPHLHALIVDPCADDRAGLRDLLQGSQIASFTFTEADDGAQALQKIDVKDTDLVFVESSLPGVDGCELVRTLRAKWNYVGPTVMVTAERRAAKVREAIDGVGVDGYVLKPIRPDRFVEGIRGLVARLPEENGRATIEYEEVVPAAASEVLASACNLATEEVGPDEDVKNGDVIFGLVSVLGSVNWSCVLGFRRDTSEGVCKAFAGFDIPYESADMGDAVGELTNIFAGQIKRSLVGRGEKVDISLPSVVRAKGLQVLVQSRSANANHTFHTPCGDLWTGLTVGKNVGFVL
jgi:CheY-like chemotaxis protein